MSSRHGFLLVLMKLSYFFSDLLGFVVVSMATKRVRLNKLEKEIESLRDNHAILLKAARIGKFKPNINANAEDQPAEIPGSLKKKGIHFQELYDQAERQQFVSQTAANQIVESAHKLIGIVNELKIAYIVNENK